MTQSRTKTFAKLFLLLGIPLFIVVLLFSGGVYLGVRYQGQILRFERDWLKMNVEVPDVPAAKEAQEVERPRQEEPVDEKPPVLVVPPKEPSTPDSKQIDPQASVRENRSPSVGDSFARPDDVTHRYESQKNERNVLELRKAKPVPLTLALPDPLPTELHALHANKLNLKVKALVDPKIVATSPDWIAEIQQTLTWASQIFESQLGISLEIYGILQWPEITDEMTKEQLLANLSHNAADGADVVLVFHAREREYHPQEVANSQAKVTSAAIIFAEPDSQAPYLRSLLYELSALLGASPIIQIDHPDVQAGSWMSLAQLSDHQPLWMDANNRRRILEHKKSFITHMSERGQHD